MSKHRLRDRAAFIRSKNAGPFAITIDIFFESREDLDLAWRCEDLAIPVIASLYGVSTEHVQRFRIDQALAMKISLPRPIPAGESGDTDVAGGQQFAPLLNVTF